MSTVDLYDLTDEQIAEAIRFNGANAMIDALLVVAAEAYGDEALANLTRLVSERAARMSEDNR